MMKFRSIQINIVYDSGYIFFCTKPSEGVFMNKNNDQSNSDNGSFVGNGQSEKISAKSFK